MRFIQNLTSETTHLLQKVYQKSKHHRVRQCAQCIWLSSQGYPIKELSHIFQVDRITIYNWFDHWESRRFAGLYDRKGRGRPPLFNQAQKEQIREWIKQYPKNLNRIIGLIQQEFNISASKSTIKRVLKSMKLTWRRIRRKVKDQPDPEDYQRKREALDILTAEDQEGLLICVILTNLVSV